MHFTGQAESPGVPAFQPNASLLSGPPLRSLWLLISMISAFPAGFFSGVRLVLLSAQILRSMLALRSGLDLRSRPDLLSGMCPVYENCLRSIPKRLPPLSILLSITGAGASVIFKPISSCPSRNGLFAQALHFQMDTSSGFRTVIFYPTLSLGNIS